jgi:hypothetical protein
MIINRSIRTVLVLGTCFFSIVTYGGGWGEWHGQRGWSGNMFSVVQNSKQVSTKDCIAAYQQPILAEAAPNKHTIIHQKNIEFSQTDAMSWPVSQARELFLMVGRERTRIGGKEYHLEIKFAFNCEGKSSDFQTISCQGIFMNKLCKGRFNLYGLPPVKLASLLKAIKNRDSLKKN